MKIPKDPLLFVPLHATRTVAALADKAGVPVETVDGKLVFHGLRVSYINLLLALGVDIKTVQEEARHQSSQMTMRYARRHKERMVGAQEQLGTLIAGLIKRPDNAPQAEQVHFEKAATPNNIGGCGGDSLVGETGFEAGFGSRTDGGQVPDSQGQTKS